MLEVYAILNVSILIDNFIEIDGQAFYMKSSKTFYMTALDCLREIFSSCNINFDQGEKHNINGFEVYSLGKKGDSFQEIKCSDSQEKLLESIFIQTGDMLCTLEDVNITGYNLYYFNPHEFN